MNTWMFKNSGRRSSQEYTFDIIGVPSGHRWCHGEEITALFTREMKHDLYVVQMCHYVWGSSLAHSSLSGCLMSLKLPFPTVLPYEPHTEVILSKCPCPVHLLSKLTLGLKESPWELEENEMEGSQRWPDLTYLRDSSRSAFCPLWCLSSSVDLGSHDFVCVYIFS